jgi:Ran GTPase-activating protein (RanGAP) involved in mRNA processing and transport
MKSFFVEIIYYQNTKLEEIIQQEKNHSKIYLYQQNLTDRDMEIIIKQAIDKKQCKELYLGSNKFTSIGVSILADALNNNNQILESLWLYDNQVCDDGVYSLVKALSMNNKTLKKLDLGNTKITNVSVKHLAQMLKINKTLTHLYLNQNEIADNGIRILASTIQNHNTTIEVLHLSENKLLTDECVDSLLSMIKHNQSLKVLRVYDCSLSEKSKERLNTLAKSKKNFEIYPYNLVK